MELLPSHAWTRIFGLCDPRNVVSVASASRALRSSAAGNVAARFARTLAAYTGALDKVPTDAWLFALSAHSPFPSAQTIVASLYPEHFGAATSLDHSPYDGPDHAIVLAARYQLSVLAFKWRVRDLRDIAVFRSFDTYDPACLSFKARIARSQFSLPRKYYAHLSNAAANALKILRADPTLSSAHRTFLDGNARYTRVPAKSIRFILRKRELKPNYARQFGPVEVWDVRDVPFQRYRPTGLVLCGAVFPCGTHDTRFWHIDRKYPL